MNITATKHPDETAKFFHHPPASEAGFTNLFEWFISRQDEDLEELLIACHAHVIELIDHINGDRSPVDENVQKFRDSAREIGFDKLIALFLHGVCEDCVEGDLYAAESYIDELINQVAESITTEHPYEQSMRSRWERLN